MEEDSEAVSEVGFDHDCWVEDKFISVLNVCPGVFFEAPVCQGETVLLGWDIQVEFWCQLYYNGLRYSRAFVGVFTSFSLIFFATCAFTVMSWCMVWVLLAETFA